MKIAVIGASGNAGSRITAELARRGHSVTAIVRNPDKIAAQPNVTPAKGDVSDQAGLVRLVSGHDAVISSVRFLASDPAKLIAEFQEVLIKDNSFRIGDTKFTLSALGRAQIKNVVTDPGSGQTYLDQAYAARSS